MNNPNYINKFLVITVLSFAVLFSACNRMVYFDENYIIENKTNQKFIVYFEKTYSDTKQTKEIRAFEPEITIYNNVKLVPQPSIARQHFKFWIYNPIDSTHYIITRDDIDSKMLDYGVKEKFTTEKDITKYTVSVQINETLIGRMTKNTELTDSIFRLKSNIYKLFTYKNLINNRKTQNIHAKNNIIFIPLSEIYYIRKYNETISTHKKASSKIGRLHKSTKTVVPLSAFD